MSFIDMSKRPANETNNPKSKKPKKEPSKNGLRKDFSFPPQDPAKIQHEEGYYERRMKLQKTFKNAFLRRDRQLEYQNNFNNLNIFKLWKKIIDGGSLSEKEIQNAFFTSDQVIPNIPEQKSECFFSYLHGEDSGSNGLDDNDKEPPPSGTVAKSPQVFNQCEAIRLLARTNGYAMCGNTICDEHINDCTICGSEVCYDPTENENFELDDACLVRCSMCSEYSCQACFFLRDGDGDAITHFFEFKEDFGIGCAECQSGIEFDLWKEGEYACGRCLEFIFRASLGEGNTCRIHADKPERSVTEFPFFLTPEAYPEAFKIEGLDF